MFYSIYKKEAIPFETIAPGPVRRREFVAFVNLVEISTPFGECDILSRMKHGHLQKISITSTTCYIYLLEGFKYSPNTDFSTTPSRYRTSYRVNPGNSCLDECVTTFTICAGCHPLCLDASMYPAFDPLM